MKEEFSCIRMIGCKYLFQNHFEIYAVTGAGAGASTAAAAGSAGLATGAGLGGR